MPKSSSFTMSFTPDSTSDEKMLSGLRSRWTMPARCAAAERRRVPAHDERHACLWQPPLRAMRVPERLAREQLHHQYGVPSSLTPKSKTSTMFG